ncbi:hypothetical protein DPMN_116647 [Dreissena polymorpha]|uniref:Uncharacterized protein n=1 Tax=Dreissena polymorpha TaxID=45954 RepID=A0A9D4KNE3_DREPO|nr:hypothetical protein DPMN_116647 [Dreissena polymorpha]
MVLVLFSSWQETVDNHHNGVSGTMWHASGNHNGPGRQKIFNRSFEQNANAHAKDDAPKSNNVTINALVSATTGLKGSIKSFSSSN